MLADKELYELANGVLTETLHGNVPMNTVAELAAGVVRLVAEDAPSLEVEQERRATVFEEYLVDRVALAELRDFWRDRYYSKEETNNNQKTKEGDN